MPHNGGRGPIIAAGGRALDETESPRRRCDALTNGRVLRNDKFGNILHEYLLLELGKSKKEIFNKISLSQSMRIYSKMHDTNNPLQLLHMVLQSKAINTQFEVKLQLACMDIDDSQIKAEDKKEVKSVMSVGPLTLKSTQLEDSDFKNQFFLSRSSFQKALTSLKGYIGDKTIIDVEKQLMVTLSYLGTVYSYEEISSKFNISISTAQQYVSYVANKFFEHMDSVILWPSHQQANLEVQGFDEMPGNKFPGVLGVIGTVELNNSTTANPNPSERTNYKSSIVIQGVCNSKYEFFNVFICYLLNSSVTAETFHESFLAKQIMNNPETLFPNKTTHLVGSSCYPLLPNLMTPFPVGPYSTALQNNYNVAIETPLNVIKLAFGKLFGRFKRLTCLDFWGEEKFAVLIFTACYLHNLCQKNNDDIYSEAYKCCTFSCKAVDTISLKKRQEICNNLISEPNLKLNSST